MSNLAQAASDNDAQAEEIGLEETVKSLGLDLAELSHVATQRALRAVVKETRGWHAGPFEVNLTTLEYALVAKCAACAMDGISIGWRAAKEAYGSQEDQ